ncbi:protein kinase [Vitiosangium sp. GDMCC 1.1324]|uniref:serine/threonine protein kinase n=1 Tax=Vitiosangium sp. (strain GDMCC 1.1324) TaxID=2138576 RepID=UPI000D371936|nr:protein kinase [Vitiosangium sp. GDMCC 1.1324]PTL82045.1 serine/threonine protein kinase [Vitiosangium sp. GDMCC 1.1324]
MDSDSRKQTAHGKEPTKRVLFSHEGTDYLVVWRMDTTPSGLERYLVRPRTRGHVGPPMEVEVVPSRAPEWARLRLKEEAELASRLMHPAIERVLGLHQRGEKHFLLKEHVDGCSLASAISFGVLRGDRWLSEAFCLYMASAVAEALHAAHTAADEGGQPLGIIHRAVNPCGVRIGWDGSVKLGDFASAYSLLPQRLRTPKGLFRGEIEYAAPERLVEPRTAVPDTRMDLFSLGVVLLEALTGNCLYGLASLEAAAGLVRWRPVPRRMVRAERPSWATLGEMAALAAALRPEHVEEALHGVSEPVKNIVHEVLRRDPGERYATAADFRSDLQACLRAMREQPYGSRAASLELLQARTEAEGSPLREEVSLTERGVFPEDIPRYS